MTEVQSCTLKFSGWKNLALLTLIYFLNFGLIFYAFAAIFPAMVESLQWSRGNAGLAHTLCMTLMGLFLPVVAICINKFGLKKNIIFGIVVTVVSTVLLATVTKSIFMWILMWGILTPIGFAFAGSMPVMSVVMMWFNLKKGIAMGILLTAAAMAGFIGQPLFTWIIEKTQSWQTGWLICAGSAMVTLVLSFFVISKPQDVGQYPDGLHPDEAAKLNTDNKKVGGVYRSDVEWPLKEVLKRPAIWFIVMMSIGVTMSVFMVLSHGVLHMTDIGYEKMEAASIIGTIILSSALARFPIGWLSDRFEPRWMLSIGMGCMCLSLAVIWKAPSITWVTIAGVVFGISYANGTMLNPIIIGNYFGSTAFPSISGATAPVITLIGAIAPWGAGYVADKTGNYNIAFMSIAMVLIVATFLMALCKPPVLDTKNEVLDGKAYNVLNT